ncbi:hypothetical protein DENSPDRAFT_833983 [Dentipellis sp. KUC8613]|nr:hypothetical protein DENSPDRAFT_833983 [Dentipellis sp. KUC8613]
MSPESFPNALLPIGPLPPTLDFGFSVSIDQINAICSEVEPFENPAVKIKNEYLVAMVKVIVGTSLTKACGHPVHLVEVVNHPDGFVVSFGDNYHFSSMQKTLKKFHVGELVFM